MKRPDPTKTAKLTMALISAVKPADDAGASRALCPSLSEEAVTEPICTKCDADETVTPGLCECRACPSSGRLIRAEPIESLLDYASLTAELRRRMDELEREFWPCPDKTLKAALAREHESVRLELANVRDEWDLAIRRAKEGTT